MAHRVLARAKDLLLDLLFPEECFSCGEPGTYLCAACSAAVPLEEAFVCPVCLRPSFEHAVCAKCRKTTALAGVIPASPYGIPVVRRLILSCKYRSVEAIAPILARIVLRALARHPFSVLHVKDLVLVPVPLHPTRERQRGFNQAARIAQVLGEALRIPCETDALARVRRTMPQVEAGTRTERVANMRGAFAANDAALVKGKTVLLVDDVATTLATLDAAAHALKEAGAREVWGLVVAREY